MGFDESQYLDNNIGSAVFFVSLISVVTETYCVEFSTNLENYQQANSIFINSNKQCV